MTIDVGTVTEVCQTDDITSFIDAGVGTENVCFESIAIGTDSTNLSTIDVGTVTEVCQTDVIPSFIDAAVDCKPTMTNKCSTTHLPATANKKIATLKIQTKNKKTETINRNISNSSSQTCLDMQQQTCQPTDTPYEQVAMSKKKKCEKKCVAKKNHPLSQDHILDI
jgi:hypothetical protein